MLQAPPVVFVTGLPATGKTTLAHALAAELRLPLFTKDRIKESLFDTLGWSDRAWSRKLGVASTTLLFQMLEAQVAAGRGCIVESNFHPEFDTQRALDVQARYPFRCAQVLCVAEGATVWARYTTRTRHPGHCDAVVAEELRDVLAQGRSAPLAVAGPILEVDTNSAVNVAELVAQLRSRMDNSDV